MSLADLSKEDLERAKTIITRPSLHLDDLVEKLVQAGFSGTTARRLAKPGALKKQLAKNKRQLAKGNWQSPIVTPEVKTVPAPFVQFLREIGAVKKNEHIRTWAAGVRMVAGAPYIGKKRLTKWSLHAISKFTVKMLLKKATLSEVFLRPLELVFSCIGKPAISLLIEYNNKIDISKVAGKARIPLLMSGETEMTDIEIRRACGIFGNERFYRFLESKFKGKKS